MSSGCSSTYPVSFVTRDCQWMRGALRLTLAAFCVLAFCCASYAQSTFGTVLGTVKDPSGSAVPMAKVSLMNTGTNAEHTTVTNNDGAYTFVSIDVGNYRLTVEAPGFQKTEFQAFDLAARQTVRLDVDLKVATQAETVTVEDVATIQTDVSNVAETKGSLELTDLPVAIYTRSQGSTSAFSTLTAQPGVQTDNQNNITVAGAMPSQLSFTIDGISSNGPGQTSSQAVGVALAELFPSFNAIEEIKISENLNPAEYGGVADITTVSKSGTNTFHGGLFENVQNTDFNASDTFSHLQTPVKLNNFGAYIGGPVIFPKLYNGRNKTFFFASGEFLRLPKSLTAVESVPTQAMRNGDLSVYLDPANGGAANQLTGYPGNIIPPSQLNSFSQKLLNFFYPLPNYGPPGAIANNYLATFAIPINSAQGDVRVDEAISSKHLVYVRYTYKNRRVADYPKDTTNEVAGSPLVGTTSRPEIYNSFVAAYNWIVTPSVVNELRGGFSTSRVGYSTGLTAQESANMLGLTSPPLPQAIPTSGDLTPTITLTGFAGSRPQNVDINPSQGTYQVLDTVTFTRSKHTMKFGADFRYLSALFTNVFQDYRLGEYQFNGSTTSAILGSGAATPIAGMLLGYPDLTTVSTVLNPATDAYSEHYAFFGQDDFKVSQSLTINFGLRWEYHPGFKDINNNVGNFDPYYSSVINGQTVKGAIVVPDQNTFVNVNPQFAETVAPLPIITAAQAHIPYALRFSSKKDFAPRIGFAYRLGGSNKTVLRGGYGRFIETLQTASVINGWSVESSDVGFFSNSFTNGTPLYQLPNSYPSNIAQPGTYFFDLANEIKYKDPIVEEWNLTLERDLGKGTGVRASYSGNHSYNVPAVVNYDQPHVNTLGFNNPQTQADIPYPQIAYLATNTNLGFGNYQAGTISVHKRSSSFQFEASYTYSRDLSNIMGSGYSSAAAFVTEGAFNNTLSDPYHPGLDYGNVPFDRRNRFLATFFYELPFGKGKAFLNTSSGLLDKFIGGFVLSGVALFQSGPFLTVTTLQDPSGTGYNTYGNLFGVGGRADTVPGVSPYAGQSVSGYWINPAAFTDPCTCGANGPTIGRFGDSLSGAVEGPGTRAVSLSLLKRIPITETVRLEFGAQVSNVTNHPNYAPPATLTVGVAGFGALTAMQSAEGAGPRQIQLTGRLTF